MTLVFREARAADLPEIVNLLADDALGAGRERFEDPLPDTYTHAFEAISRDSNNQLLLAELDGQLAGFLQLTFIPGLTYTGRSRAQVEGVRVSETVRGQGSRLRGRAARTFAGRAAVPSPCR